MYLTSFYRQVHLYRSSFPPGAADGLLLDPDVHPQPPYCHSVLDLLLDQYGCCTCSRWPGDHHSPHYDHTEFRFPSITAQGRNTLIFVGGQNAHFLGTAHKSVTTQILLLNTRGTLLPSHYSSLRASRTNSSPLLKKNSAEFLWLAAKLALWFSTCCKTHHSSQ